ncbi:MAG: LysM domain/BON superfamily protein [Planctomycetaceae bacterium]|nr:LysM domain/BON superfamily protein [Planctomycetaceae bacterium]
MQRDLKVGLSLAVLVLGVVGAFLFRREQVSENRTPTLKTARKIDERIAERPRTPYMTGDVEFDQDEASTAKERQDGLSSNDRPAHAVPPNWLEDEEDPFQVARSPQSNSGAIQVPPRAGSSNLATDTAQTATLQTHIIQSGESLSTIAEHYLGSQGRFQELYDANRDVLTDPNRLPLGTTIVIPPKNKVASKAHAPAQAPLTAKSAVGHPERVRGTITDVSTIEPISPATTGAPADREVEPAKPADQVAAPTPVVPTQTRETRRLFSPSRLPFSNNRTAPTKRAPKPLDPEGEDFVAPTVTPSTVAPANDAAHETTGETRLYQVRKGDSLEKISQKAYGNAKRAADIFAANRAQLASPDAVREGQELILPN